MYQLSKEQIKYQQREFARVKREAFLKDLREAFRRITSPRVWLIAIGGLGLVATGCTATTELNPPTTPYVDATEISATQELATTEAPTAIPTPTEIVEPTPLPPTPTEVLPVNPPNFNTAAEQLDPNGPFDLIDAHAVYALYRQEVGPAMWPDDTAFIQAMETYSQKLAAQGIELAQATRGDTTYSMLVKDGKQLLLQCTENGALADTTPGHWRKDTIQRWVDAGGPVGLVIGDDKMPYIVRRDATGQVTDFFNPLGATLDNLDERWIKVENGMSTELWNDQTKEWSTEPPQRAFFGLRTKQEIIGDYTCMAPDQMRQARPNITVIDLQNPDLGLVAQESKGSIEGAYWVIGKIAALQHGRFNLPAGSDDILELIVDVPDSSKKQVIRFYLLLYPLQFELGANLEPLLDEIHKYRDDGKDPLQNFVIHNTNYKNEIIVNPYTSHRQKFNQFVNQPDLIGRQFGFLIPQTADRIPEGQNKSVGEIPNFALEMLKDPNVRISEKDQRELFFQIYGVAFQSER